MLVGNSRGIALLACIQLLVLLTLSVMATARLLTDEQRMVTSLADYQGVLQLAEMALTGAEADVLAMDRQLQLGQHNRHELMGGGLFSADCYNTTNPLPWRQGLCLSPGLSSSNGLAAVWERTSGEAEAKPVPFLHPCGRARRSQVIALSAEYTCPRVSPAGKYWAAPVFLVELLAFSPDNELATRTYRITLRAWGKSEGTMVTLQSYFQVYKPSAISGKSDTSAGVADEWVGRRHSWREISS